MRPGVVRTNANHSRAGEHRQCARLVLQLGNSPSPVSPWNAHTCPQHSCTGVVTAPLCFVAQKAHDHVPLAGKQMTSHGERAPLNSRPQNWAA